MPLIMAAVILRHCLLWKTCFLWGDGFSLTYNKPPERIHRTASSLPHTWSNSLSTPKPYSAHASCNSIITFLEITSTCTLISFRLLCSKLWPPCMPLFPRYLFTRVSYLPLVGFDAAHVCPRRCCMRFGFPLPLLYASNPSCA